jgi:hypothetical protein
MRSIRMLHILDTNNDCKVIKQEFMHYYKMVWDQIDEKHLLEIGVNEWVGINTWSSPLQ